MFAARLMCSWIGVFGLAAGAFGQTYVQFSLDAFTFPTSINDAGTITGWYQNIDGTESHSFVRSSQGNDYYFRRAGKFTDICLQHQ